ncbi:ACT domain-containing protein [Ructibacterium gallinarum]|nr:ACT domain-containing protein [Ructibacterium gallinarum]
MRAVVTVMGIDKPGIIAGTSTLLADNNVNILDITQTIVQNIFTMVMLVDIENSKLELSALAEELNALGKRLAVEIRIQHEDIFNSMHRI